MASDAPSWADQWGAGGIGSMGDDKGSTNDQEANSKSSNKGDGKKGMDKAKTAAAAGAQKIKSGATNSFKWVKAKCTRKSDDK